MAGPGAAAYQDWIARALGNDEAIQVQVSAAWAIQAPRSADLYLVYLRTFLACVGLMLGTLDEAPTVPVESDLADRERVRLNALQTMQRALQAELAAVEAVGGGTGGVATGVIAVATPLPAPAGWWPDANSPVYRGLPYGWVRPYGPGTPTGAGWGGP